MSAGGIVEKIGAYGSVGGTFAIQPVIARSQALGRLYGIYWQYLRGLFVELRVSLSEGRSNAENWSDFTFN